MLELKVLELLLEAGEMTAVQLMDEFRKRENWSDITTLSVIRSCLMTDLIKRTSRFTCRPLMNLDEAKVLLALEKKYN